MGADIEFVAQHTGINEQELIRIHSGTDYLVYMMGFSPGFAYLGGLDGRLATPRLQSPRTEIPAGAVGIAETQTGVYPMASPGGWQLIGRTPLKLFDPTRERPVLLSAGDYVCFVPLASRDEYDAILQQVESGEYQATEEYLKMSTSTLQINQPGMLSTVQDTGRYGYQRFGMPTAGAMDTFALRAANALLGNDLDAAGIEATVLGPRITPACRHADRHYGRKCISDGGSRADTHVASCVRPQGQQA